MRRAAVILLLIASHGSAVWLGVQRHAARSAATATRTGTPTESGLTLQSVVDAVHAANTARDKAPDVDEEEILEAQLKAARERLPADADLEAMVKAGTLDPEADFSLQTIAAFGLWLDRDPMAAIRWFGPFDRDNDYTQLTEELARHFKRSSLADAPSYFDAAPRARETLVNCMGAALEELNDPALVLRVGESLREMADRRELLSSAFGDRESLTGRLGMIRRLLDNSSANDFLSHFSGDRALLDEARAAGFPALILENLEEKLAAREGPGESPEEAVENALTYSTSNWTSDNITFKEGFKKAVPDFDAWELQLIRGRLAPQVLHSRLVAALPEGSRLDLQLMRLVVEKGLKTDPEGMVRWVKDTRPDWQDEVDRIISNPGRQLAPETLAGLVIQVSGDAEPSQKGLETLGYRFESWYVKDPQACLEGIADLPPGPVKSKLQAICQKKQSEEERGHEPEEADE